MRREGLGWAYWGGFWVFVGADGLGRGWRFRIGFWDAVNADDIADTDVLEVRKLEI